MLRNPRIHPSWLLAAVLVGTAALASAGPNGAVQKAPIDAHKETIEIASVRSNPASGQATVGTGNSGSTQRSAQGQNLPAGAQPQNYSFGASNPTSGVVQSTAQPGAAGANNARPPRNRPSTRARRQHKP